MNNKITISIGKNLQQKRWKEEQWTWDELCARCSDTQILPYTMDEYLALPRDEQLKAKDVGGFVTARLRDGSRTKGCVISRTAITLDLDYAEIGVWAVVLAALPGVCVLMYSTAKHMAARPRLRIVIPLSREVSSTEHEALARHVASLIGIEQMDITTYQPNRLFFWPATVIDGDFVFERQDGEFLDVDALLPLCHVDDASQWPRSSMETADVDRQRKEKADDPLGKKGIVGAFCRVYDIASAAEKYLPGVYAPSRMRDRMTYTAGKSANGLALLEDGYVAYAWDATDPCSGKAVNAWDLVRLHLFGSLDTDGETDINKMKSQKAMEELAMKDPAVKAAYLSEKAKEAAADFAGLDDATDGDNADEAEVPAWMADLAVKKSGELKVTAPNFALILENDPRLKGKVLYNEFADRLEAVGGLPWRKEGGRWSDADDSNLRLYLEKAYGISQVQKTHDALVAVAFAHAYHPVRDYLNALPKWDGEPRLDSLIIDYLGAEDSHLTRLATRRMFVGAVRRVMEPGCKHDNAVVLAGKEGIGKSTLLSVMGGEWFTDSFQTFEGKDAMEQMQGRWIFELGELTSIKRSDAETVKRFLTSQSDVFRSAYARHTSEHKRQCVFFGTTNEELFLKGDDGNRRFWPIAVGVNPCKFDDPRAWLVEHRDQLWAEALYRYRKGEPNYLDKDDELAMRKRQEDFNDSKADNWKEALEMFLSTRLPADWDNVPLCDRRKWWDGRNSIENANKEIIQRTHFCAAEFLCELMGKNRGDVNWRYYALRVGKLMKDMPMWVYEGTSRHVPKIYSGTAKTWKYTGEIVNPDVVSRDGYYYHNDDFRGFEASDDDDGL